MVSKQCSLTRRRGERGQTIVLVAISIVSLLAMAALAIDVVTLYVARSEIQRAADAAALAGAKAIADSGITTLNNGDLAGTPGIQALAQSMAISAVKAVIANNLVAGSPAGLSAAVSPNPSFNFDTKTTTPIYSWQVTVTLQQTSLPTFFARIFGKTGASTQATAVAEAYNPANITPNTTPSQFTPIAPKCVKPFFVANADPRQSGNPFVAPPSAANAGAIEAGVIAEPDFYLTADCVNQAGSTCTLQSNPPTTSTVPYTEVQYVPATVTTNPGNVCPASGGSGSFAQSIQCCDQNPYQYLNCGGSTAPSATWNQSVNPTPLGAQGADFLDAVESLIHATGTGTGTGQDSIYDYASDWPTEPPQIFAKSGATVVSTSSSVVTIPIIDTSATIPSSGGDVTIVGFLQAFIEQINTNNDMQIKVMNVVGCGSPNGSPVIVGGNGASAIPIRLISP